MSILSQIKKKKKEKKVLIIWIIPFTFGKKRKKDTVCVLLTPLGIAAVFKVISAIYLIFSLWAESKQTFKITTQRGAK